MLVLRMIEEQHHRDAEDGRPLREGRTPPALLRPGELEYRTCPYAGTRSGQPMNTGALKQTGARWGELSAALALLRAAYTTARGGVYGPDLLDLWRVSQLGSALPWFYVLRGAPLPAFAAALSKATLGTGILAQRLFVEVLATHALPALTSAALLEAAERTGTLIAEREVCAAPARMIVGFLDALVAPAAPVPPAADPAGGPVAALAAERGALVAFGAHYLALKHLLWASHLARRFIYADLAAALADRPVAAGARELLAAPCEPPDFFDVGPADPAGEPLERRGAWFRALALPLVPLVPAAPGAAPGAASGAAPGAASDAAQCARGIELAAIAGAPPDAGAAAAAAAEVAAVTGAAPAAAALAGRALAQYVRLDALLGDILACAEAGFAAALGVAGGAAAVTAAARDRAVAAAPRRYLAALAPAWLAAHARL